MTRSRAVKTLGYAIVLAAIMVSVELASYISFHSFLSKRAGFLLHSPTSVDEARWNHYSGVRDPVLGWPTAEFVRQQLDASGSRPVPAFPLPGKECVSLYGDSFTYGSEVDDGEAWGNLLSQNLGCRVSNFGVPAYGTDQAALRFELNEADRAPVSILGIFSRDILRNVNQYRAFLSSGQPFGFKPRFSLAEDGSLYLVPIPLPSFQELGLLRAAGGSLTHETFVPGNGFGPVPVGFPYTLMLVRFVTHEQVRNWLLGRPSWMGYLDRDHPSKALLVTVKIVERFMQICGSREKECFVLLFPTPREYEFFSRTGNSVVGPLTEQFDELGIPYLSLTEHLKERLGPRSYCDLLTSANLCVGHPNAEVGNPLIAEIVETYITDFGYTQAIRSMSTKSSSSPTIRQ